jgi:hypothetical protein
MPDLPSSKRLARPQTGLETLQRTTFTGHLATSVTPVARASAKGCPTGFSTAGESELWVRAQQEAGGPIESRLPFHLEPSVSEDHVYRGDLTDRPIAEILYTIYLHRVAGKIEATTDDTVKTIYVRDGHIVHASSSNLAESLGAYLLNVGMISKEDYTTTMRARRDAKIPYGVMLVEEGLLSPADLYKAIRLQNAEIVWTLFSWQAGRVTFDIGEFNRPVGTAIQVPVRQAIKEGVRRVEDVRGLLERIGGRGTVLEGSHQTDDLIEVALRREEYDLLQMVDGKRTLYELCTEGPFDPRTNGRLLYAYYVLEFVRPAAKTGVGSKTAERRAIKIRLSRPDKPS